MEVLVEDGSEKKKKKKKHKRGPETMCLPGEKVEVRSLEAGFAGSWHSGFVTNNSGYSCSVEYEHMLLDDCSGKLTEDIDFPSRMESTSHKRGTLTHNSGRIRPKPPPLHITKWKLHYGLCVDALHNDAWWEGVVFDHEDAKRKRLIFFPDLGDEMLMGIDNLRITQDWDEVSEEWKCRGDWLFLQLIEKYEEQYPLLVSVRQLWYDVRTKDEFQEFISDWTIWVESAWDHLVLDAFVENTELILDKVLDFTNLKEGLKSAKVPSKRRKTWESDLSLCRDVSGALKRAKNYASGFSVCDDGSSTETLPSNSNSAMDETSEEYIVDAGNFIHQMEDDSLGMDLSIDMNGSYREEISMQPQALSVLSSERNAFASMRSNGTTNESSLESKAQDRVVLDTAKNCGSKNGPCSKSNCKRKSSELRSKSHWLPVNAKILTGAEYHPDAIEEYSKLPENMKPSPELASRLRKHLSYLGWRVETKRDLKMRRISYVSPGGQRYHSFPQVYNALMKAAEVVRIQSSRKNEQSLVGVTGGSLGSKCQQIFLPRNRCSSRLDLLKKKLRC